METLKKLIFILCLLLSTNCYANTRAIYGHVSEDGVRPILIDKLSGSLEIIDFEHHELHEGNAYFFDGFADLGAGNDRDHTITTGSSPKLTHLIYEVSAEAEHTFTIFENCTVLNDGTVIPIFNHDRTSSNVSNNTLSEDSTITVEGTVLIQEKVGSGNKIGGGTRGSMELILLPNTKYTLRVSNDASTTSWHDIELDWYEHESKN